MEDKLRLILDKYKKSELNQDSAINDIAYIMLEELNQMDSDTNAASHFNLPYDELSSSGQSEYEGLMCGFDDAKSYFSSLFSKLLIL